MNLVFGKGNDMEENQLKEIEERCKKATPGPWIENESSTYTYVRTRDGESYICSALDRDNSKFIAHSRKDIPRLLAHIKTLHNVIASQKLFLDGDMEQIKMLNGAIRELESRIPRWIPVAERSPEEPNVQYFVRFREGDMHFNFGIRWGNQFGPMVTHWMEIPKGPEDK